MSCWLVIGTFKHLARFLSYIINFYCIIIMLVSYPIYKEHKQRSWQSIGTVNAGAWVRFPGPPTYSIYFALTRFYAVLHQGFTIQPHHLACHTSNNSNPKARMGSPPWTPVKRSTRKSEKSKRPPSNGPNCFLLTSKLGQPPPMFAFSFSIFILFFYLF